PGSRDGLARALAARRRSTDEVWALGAAASPGTSLGPGGPLPPAPADSGSSRDADLHPEAAPADGADAARRRHARLPAAARAAGGRGAAAPRRGGGQGRRRGAPGGAGPPGAGPRTLAPVRGLDLGARAGGPRAVHVDGPAGLAGDPHPDDLERRADDAGDRSRRRRTAH